MNCIDLRSLTFAYPGGATIFDAFSWQVEAGQAWAVIGPSGCGKTTLLYLLAGLRRPSGGTVYVGGQPLARPRPATGLILQDYGLLPWVSLRDNAALGLRLRRYYGPDGRHAPHGRPLRSQDVDRLVSFWLERLGLAHVAHLYPSQISGGQRQRTAIARTLALQPDLLLMDEPFASLDAPTREDLQNLMVELRAEQALTTLIVTHNIDDAVFMGQRILVLGRLPQRAPLIIENPRAGDPSYRTDPAFLECAAKLRAAIDL